LGELSTLVPVNGRRDPEFAAELVARGTKSLENDVREIEPVLRQ
jgi:hypothetical protein